MKHCEQLHDVFGRCNTSDNVEIDAPSYSTL